MAGRWSAQAEAFPSLPPSTNRTPRNHPTPRGRRGPGRRARSSTTSRTPPPRELLPPTASAHHAGRAGRSGGWGCPPARVRGTNESAPPYPPGNELRSESTGPLSRHSSPPQASLIRVLPAHRQRGCEAGSSLCTLRAPRDRTVDVCKAITPGEGRAVGQARPGIAAVNQRDPSESRGAAKALRTRVPFRQNKLEEGQSLSPCHPLGDRARP